MKNKWIYFEDVTPKDRKTKVWFVRNKKSQFVIGTVSWYSPWRTYAFFPEVSTVYEDDCLKDIACFIEDQMNARKMKKELMYTK